MSFRPTCSEEVYVWDPPFLSGSMERVALIAGSRTIRTGLKMYNYNGPGTIPLSPIDNAVFYLGPVEVKAVMMCMALESTTYMRVVRALRVV